MNEDYQEMRARKKTEDRIPYWIEKGKAFIYPERMERWEEFVEARAEGYYQGKDLDFALALMEKLESGASMEEVKKMFEEQGHIISSPRMVIPILFHFSKRGPEFYESMLDRKLLEEDIIAIEKKKRENIQLEKLHRTDSKKEGSDNRQVEENEIIASASEKTRLISEIHDVETQLEELGKEGTGAKRTLEEK